MNPGKSDSWFEQYIPKYVEDVNIYPNISIYNRKLYTFGGKEEVYNKFLSYNTEILSLDELAYLDTNSCVFRIDVSRYIVVISVEVKSEEGKSQEGKAARYKTAVIGELNKRYIEKNKLNSYKINTRDSKDYLLVQLSEIYRAEAFKFEDLNECASSRIKKSFAEYMKQIRYGTTTFND
ncbi:hypothetical protein G9P44_005833 [Scheffersomyces stipitis]|nr:hypothetical protein G9P44_005833 [Scheffersomyces stipitis]